MFSLHNQKSLLTQLEGRIGGSIGLNITRYSGWLGRGRRGSCWCWRLLRRWFIHHRCGRWLCFQLEDLSSISYSTKSPVHKFGFLRKGTRITTTPGTEIGHGIFNHVTLSSDMNAANESQYKHECNENTRYNESYPEIHESGSTGVGCPANGGTKAREAKFSSTFMAIETIK